MNKNEDEKGKKFFEIFSKYFWIGIATVLTSIILQKSISSEIEYYFFVEIIIVLFSTLGLTIIVASLFTYTLGTKEFIGYIEAKLEDIIIDRNFLNNMDSEKKIEALHSILKPTEIQQKRYSDLDQFYEYYVKDVMSVADKNVRSDYNIRLDIHYDNNEKKIYGKGTVVYRLYPSEKGYVPITLGLEKDSNLSKCSRLEIFRANGSQVKVDLSALEYKDGSHDNMQKAIIELSDYAGDQHLNIEIDFIEYGYDHWMASKFLVYQPTDGINFEINCFDDITIKEKIIYDINSKYHVTSDNDTQYKISSHQWIQEGSGYMVIVSKPEEIEESIETNEED